MDQSLFVSSNSANNATRQLEVLTNNLANLNTTGFRYDQVYSQQYNVKDPNLGTRTFSQIAGTYTNFTHGSIMSTSRDLDLAIRESGFIAVQSQAGKEGYVRTGSLMLSQDGSLMTSKGDFVLGTAGIINVPPAQKIQISPDGTVSAILLGTTDVVTIDKIKLVNPDTSGLQKGEDGNFYLVSGGTVDQDETVNVVTGALEGSNVNVIETMARLIDLSRNYEIHTNYMKNISDNTAKSNQILEL